MKESERDWRKLFEKGGEISLRGERKRERDLFYETNDANKEIERERKKESKIRKLKKHHSTTLVLVFFFICLFATTIVSFFYLSFYCFYI